MVGPQRHYYKISKWSIFCSSVFNVTTITTSLWNPQHSFLACHIFYQKLLISFFPSRQPTDTSAHSLVIVHYIPTIMKVSPKTYNMKIVSIRFGNATNFPTLIIGIKRVICSSENSRFKTNNLEVKL